MATYEWTKLANKATIAFSSLPNRGDILKFDLPSIHAPLVTVTWQDSTSVTFAYEGKSITILADVKTLTQQSIQFADGSALVFGDNQATTADDDRGNTMGGGGYYVPSGQYFGLGGDDNIYGSGGDDRLNGGDGDDKLFGYSGNDTLDGGGGFNGLFGDDGDDVYIISSRDFYIGETSGQDTAIVRTSFVKIPTTIERVIYENNAQPLPYWIAALIPDEAALFRSLVGDAKTFYYVYPTSIDGYRPNAEDRDGFQPFNNNQKAFSVLAMNYVASIVDLRFVPTADPYNANTIAFGNNRQSGSAGYAYSPAYDYYASDVFLNYYTSSNLDPRDGDRSAYVLIHELGHALGLKHPFQSPQANGDVDPGPYLPSAEDTSTWTVMSYSASPAQYHLAYSQLDIAALQYLYGPSPTARAGADTYLISASTSNFIWDGAGVDTVSAEGLSIGVTLYLEPGYWGFVGAKSSLITSAGQITVNFGTVIENAIGGSGDDQLYGNGVNNEIKGLAGDDVIDGGEGDADVSVYRGARSDYVVTKTADNTYTVRDTVAGRDGTDTIRNVEFLAFSNGKFAVASFVGAMAGTTYKWSALTNNQSIAFDPARDKLIFDEVTISASRLGILFGGGGLTGVPAYITFTYASKSFTISGIDFKALTTSNVTFADGSLLLIGDNTVGTSTDDLANILNGSSYNDKIYALGGDDTIDGGAGDDWVLYDNSPSGVEVNLATGLARDGWNGGNGLPAQGGTDYLSNIENVEGSNYGDNLTGNGANNQFRGLSGDDTIDGGAGTDTAYYSGTSRDYIITKLANGSYTVQDKVAGRDGKDTLTNIERLGFGDSLFGDLALLANTPPTITSAATASISENISITTPVYVVTASDPDVNTTLTYSLSYTYCTDCNLFKIDSKTGAVTFITSPDFERAADSDHDNVYTLQVGVSDGLVTRYKEVTVTVTNGIDPIKSDLNGDHQTDILLQNAADGACYLWQMNSLKFKPEGVGYVGWTPPTNQWRAVGTGDFDGDGKSDILLQDGKTGDCYVWQMNGMSFKPEGVGYVGWTPPTNQWRAVGTGDFDGDGRSDILLQDGATGDCFVWEMEGLKVKESGYVGWRPPSKEWRAVGTGDFDGDGKSDILLQDGKTGDCFVWEMNGLQFKPEGVGYVGWTPPTNQWRAVGTGDYNGDGKSDILLQDGATGDCFVWEMNGLQLLSDTSSGYVGWRPPTPDWHATA